MKLIGNSIKILFNLIISFILKKLIVNYENSIISYNM